MKSPFTGKEMRAAREWRDMTFRKETFGVMFHYYICEDTGEQFEDEQFSLLNHNQVVNQYRIKHHIPFPEQIKEVRLKYELSAARISDILGMGANSWRNYEDGEMPSKANANLIQMISNPEYFGDYLRLYSELTEKERDRILNHLQKLETGACSCYNPFNRFNSQPDITTGLKAFSETKTKQVVAFFAERLQPYRTKLNKLMFYSDFCHFRMVGQSITGLRYNAIQYGPVPYKYEILFDTLSDLNFIEIEYGMTINGEVEKIVPASHYKFETSLFTPSEIATLEYIADKFKGTTANEIVEISHQEPAWKANFDEKKIIPFYYAFDLEMV